MCLDAAVQVKNIPICYETDVTGTKLEKNQQILSGHVQIPPICSRFGIIYCRKFLDVLKRCLLFFTIPSFNVRLSLQYRPIIIIII